MSTPQKFLAVSIFACFLVSLSLICVFSLLVAKRISDREDNTAQDNFNTFSSCGQLADALNEDFDKVYPPIPFLEDLVDSSIEAPTTSRDLSELGASEDADRYSTTNVQVEGVDEADIIKTDGEFIYLLFGNKLNVVRAEDGSLESTEVFDLEGSPTAMYINNDVLSVISTNIAYYPTVDVDRSGSFWPSTSSLRVYMFDISNKTNPELERRVEISGYYNNSRMFNNTIYIVANHGVSIYEKVKARDVEALLPAINDSLEDSSDIIKTECTDVSSFGETSRNFINVVAIPVGSLNEKVSSEVLLGDTYSIYMSTKNLYLTAQQYNYEGCDVVGGFLDEECNGFGNESSEITEIYKLKIDGTNLNFENYGTVPGTILNQFSMDEYEDDFRIATTSNTTNGWTSDSSNNLYVLNSNLETVGSVTGIAKGERIYSVRFMGPKAYMVTFKAVDPLFVFDLENPSDPKILGELKIPGFSDYLHPISDNLILGVGKEATEISEDWALQRGLKMGLFDVSDPNNPKQIDFAILGDRGSNSAVSYDHKAFLYDADNDLVIIPADVYKVDSEAEINEIKTLIENNGLSANDYSIRLISGYLEVFIKASVVKETVDRVFSALDENADYTNFELKSEVNILAGVEYGFFLRGEAKEFNQKEYGTQDTFGFLVYGVSKENGISEKAQLLEDRVDEEGIYYYGGYNPRSLYIGDFLYTWSGEAKLQSFKLSDFSKVDEVEVEGDYYYY